VSEDIKIAKGKSGQTDIAAGWNPNCALVGSGEGGWDVKLGGATVSSKNGYSGALSGEAGWSVNQSGTITVPSVANTGNYTAFYYAEECFDPILMEPGANNAYQYEFEVVCLTVEISATKYESNPDFSLLVCRAIASGGTPPYTYLWMAQGTGLQTLEGQGTEEVDVRVNAGASGSVSLLVTDKTAPTLCTDSDTFAIPAQPLGVFNVTVSASSGAGTASGTRDTMRFTATVEATATTPLPTPPPASIIIQAHRNIVGLNYTHQLTATLIPNLSPHKYQAQWDITRDMGKWSLQVEYPYESNTANFKIDKRSQIVQVANSWLGATAAQVGGNCNVYS
jgi:hypothetical protein